MSMGHFVAASMLVLAGSVQAQYPSRGQPDPSFNGGRPRVVAVTPQATGWDRGDVIAPLSSVRYAVLGVRPLNPLDFVAIVDTIPERVTTFEQPLATDSIWESLRIMVPIGSALLLGGTLMRADGVQVATLQVREIGIAATPSFVAHGTVNSQSSNPARPHLITTTATAQPEAGGPARVWQARTEFTNNFDCGKTILHRLDHASASFVERYQLDLASQLVRVCLVAYYASPHERQSTDPAGAVAILVGASCRDAPGSVVYVCITRVLDSGGTLSIDRTFGANGLFTHGAGSGFNFLLRDLKPDAAGRVLVPADQQHGNGALITGLLLRLRANGLLDTPFGAGGTHTIPSGGINRVAGIAVTPGGIVQAVGSSTGATGTRPYIYYYDPASGASQFSRLEFTSTEPNYSLADFNSVATLAAGGALAVGAAHTGSELGHTLIARLSGDRQTVDLLEYYNAGFGHYFLTSLLAEVQKLDDGSFAGWQRTGESFAALPTAAGGAADVCRFFSATFAPKSSHFYTPLAAECDSLKAGSIWTYEGLVFALQPPSTLGFCPVGTRSLFRLYNNGQSGAPNHRYTVSDDLRLGQVAQGWIEEGSGSPPVFACLPR